MLPFWFLPLRFFFIATIPTAAIGGAKKGDEKGWTVGVKLYPLFLFGFYGLVFFPHLWAFSGLTRFTK